MKKLLYPIAFFLILVSSTKTAYAQVADTLFIETFDTIPSLWKMSSSYTPQNQINLWYRDTVVTKDSSRGAATDTINSSGQAGIGQTNLTSPQFEIAGYASVGISFDQICYIGQYNDATVQYSFDDGATWSRMPDSSYNGPSTYNHSGDYKFSKASNPIDWGWIGNQDSIVWPSNTTAWVREDFDLTDVIISSGTQSDSARIRLSLINDLSAPSGREGTHRWIVDNFIVSGQRTVGLDRTQEQQGSEFKLYPNPTSNQFFIESSEAIIQEINIKNLEGKLVFTKQQLNSTNLKINTTDFKSGVYIVELRSKQGVKAVKLVKY